MMIRKKIVYVDMDGVLVDLIDYVYQKYAHLLGNDSFNLNEIIDSDAELFYNASPIEGAIEAFKKLCSDSRFDVYILSTAPWSNPEALMAKRLWVEKYLGEDANRKLILTHHKNLLNGDYLIDDRPNNGAALFNGTLLKFGSQEYPDWNSIILKLEEDAKFN